MNKKIAALLVISIILIFILLINFLIFPFQTQVNETGTSIHYGTITTGSRMVLDNVWGATDSENLKSYVFVKSDGSLGWEWDRPRYSGGYVPPIYPEVIVGSTPANSPSTTKAFPIRYGDINNWTSKIQFEYIKQPDGLYNMAYDIYWMNGSTKEFNVMIWVDGHYDGGTSMKSVGEVSDGKNTYIHYYRAAGQGQYWEWHCFELKNQGDSNFQVDIKALLDNAFADGTIDKNWIIPGIELGSEIWEGSGRVQINRYDVVINGNSI